MEALCVCWNCGLSASYFELLYCDKNPNGSKICENHGNEIDGMTTCEDEYCNPQEERKTFQSKEELKELAVEGWDEFKGNSPHRPWIDKVKIKHPESGLIGTRIEDVGNPWLDAGIVPFSTLGYNTNKKYWEEWFPAEFVVESFPGQFRNWFYSLLAMSAMLEGKAPFKNL